MDQLLRVTPVTIKRQLRNYARMRGLIDRWIEAAVELSDLRLQEKDN